MAAKEFLETEDMEKLTLRHVAELAEVSAPTVYAHFPTLDALAQAFFVWLKPRLGTDLVLPPLAEFGTVPAAMFPNYERYGRLLRNLMNMPAWDRLRAADWQTKQSGWENAIKAALPALIPEQTNRAAIALSAFSTPNMWRWLVDITGCTAEEAEQIAAWATHALVASLKRDADGLRSKSPLPHPTKKGRKQ